MARSVLVVRVLTHLLSVPPLLSLMAGILLAAPVPSKLPPPKPQPVFVGTWEVEWLCARGRMTFEPMGGYLHHHGDWEPPQLYLGCWSFDEKSRVLSVAERQYDPKSMRPTSDVRTWAFVVGKSLPGDYVAWGACYQGIAFQLRDTPAGPQR